MGQDPSKKQEEEARKKALEEAEAHQAAQKAAEALKAKETARPGGTVR